LLWLCQIENKASHITHIHVYIYMIYIHISFHNNW